TAPIESAITSAYGTRRTYNGIPVDTFHGGVDFGGGVGTPVLAPSDGVVMLAEPLNVRGNAVVIGHGWGVYTGYWHLDEILVTVGQTIHQGEVIGTLGNSGLSTGAHLHWELWVGGVQVNPLQWLSLR